MVAYLLTAMYAIFSVILFFQVRVQPTILIYQDVKCIHVINLIYQ